MSLCVHADDAVLVASRNGLPLPVLAGAPHHHQGCRYTGSPAEFSTCPVPAASQTCPTGTAARHRSNSRNMSHMSAPHESAVLPTAGHDKPGNQLQQESGTDENRLVQKPLPIATLGMTAETGDTMGTPGRVQAQMRSLLYFQLEGQPETRAIVTLDAVPSSSTSVNCYDTTEISNFQHPSNGFHWLGHNFQIAVSGSDVCSSCQIWPVCYCYGTYLGEAAVSW
jgi:hypothetical protein